MPDITPFRYVKGWGFDSLENQHARYRSLFPTLTMLPAVSLMERVGQYQDHGMEGMVLVPKLPSLARVAGSYMDTGKPLINPGWPTYTKALWLATGLLDRVFRGRVQVAYEGITPEFAGLAPRTAHAHEQLLYEQPVGDFFVLPVQLGQRNAGISPFEVCGRLAPSEFALDPVTLACILMVHHDRIPHFGSMRIDCPGGLYSYKGEGRYFDTSRFDIQDRFLVLDWNFMHRARLLQGTATGLVLGNL